MFEQYLKTVPAIEYVEEFDNPNYPECKAILFDGVACGGKPTKFFAYIGFPEYAEANNKVPAVVLQHGGGGFAFPEWVRQWTSRGYAAIAISNTGFIPKEKGNPNFYDQNCWTRETGNEWVLTPNNDTTEMASGDIDTQWLYHAILSGILADRLDKVKKAYLLFR